MKIHYIEITLENWMKISLKVNFDKIKEKEKN
jgi:hypothetical protein